MFQDLQWACVAIFTVSNRCWCSPDTDTPSLSLKLVMQLLAKWRPLRLSTTNHNRAQLTPANLPQDFPKRSRQTLG